jgi:hypothetical protein
MIHNHYMKWIDESLPMFDGLTPREVCTTEAGRHEVRRAIANIVPPLTDQGMSIRIPREEMLRELGLD